MDPVQEIKERISIEELVSEYLSLKKAGAHLKALCPFHAEKTPSFMVSPARGTYHCFGCGKHGDIFTFLQEMEGLDFKEALNRLADKSGIELPKTGSKGFSNKKPDEQLFKIMQEACLFYKKSLLANKEACEYLRSRGFSEKLIDSFSLGFAPDLWHGALEYLKSCGFSEKDIEKAGLIKKSDKSSGYYDRFRSRIMFPIFDEAGRVIAFSGRIFKKDDEAKYINSPETILYKKNAVLYGYHIAKSKIRKFDFSVLVEGQADLLAMHQSGFANAVALSGTALSDKQISMLKRFSQNIVLALDADDAGVGSIIKNGGRLLEFSFSVKVMPMHTGEDPADILQKEGVSAIKDRVKNSMDLFEFLISYYKTNLKRDEKYVKVLRSRVIPLLAKIDSGVEREISANKLARALRVSTESVLQDAQASKEKEKTLERKSAKTPLSTKTKTEEKLQAFGHWLSSLKDGVLSPEEKEILMSDWEALSDMNDKTQSAFENLPEEEKNKIMLSFDNDFLSDGELYLNLKEFLRNAKIFLYKKKIALLEKEISDAELSGDDERADILSKKVSQFAQELSKIIN